ncbi:hypothetical protein NM688_g6940 [Phlebia brevispora]|uniref:Uncharacterized protein n=1 Tax=Phlebia brevispora TaxID=194682 RepID=A0ACC1SAR0_9APHY|nr:hypothetical protein NM688_g6940 [Phlebia brevispora]
MHPCLAVSDIIELIADFAESDCKKDWWLCTPSPSLALAQTCHTFYDSASNIRWRHLDSFRPLLRLFFMNRVVANLKGPTSLENVIKEADAQTWSLFLSHARRVRKLQCSWTWDVIAYLKVLHRLRPDQDVPLLPGLQALTCVVEDSMVDITFPLEALAHHGLRSLRIAYKTEVLEPPSFEAASLKAPKLQNVQVSFAKLEGSRRIAANRSFVSMLPNLDHLTTLIFLEDTLPAPVLLHLAKLPHLQHLNAAIRYQSTSLLPAKDDGLFPALRSIWLSGMDILGLTRVLDVVSSTDLEVFYLISGELPKAHVVAEWVGLIARHRRLVQLSMNWHRSVLTRRPQMLPEYIVSDTSLRPLLELPHLTKLGLRDVPLRLSDSFVFDMAEAWPHLQELVLGISVRWRTTGVTLDGLKHVSARCSDLYLLAVTLDTPSVDAGTGRTKRRWLLSRRRTPANLGTNLSTFIPDAIPDDVAEVKCKSLRYLDIGNSPVQDPVALAVFITQYFPNVRHVSDLWDILNTHEGILKVPEWKKAYIDYRGLKKRINAIRSIQEEGTTPLLSTPPVLAGQDGPLQSTQDGPGQVPEVPRVSFATPQRERSASETAISPVNANEEGEETASGSLPLHVFPKQNIPFTESPESIRTSRESHNNNGENEEDGSASGAGEAERSHPQAHFAESVYDEHPSSMADDRPHTSRPNVLRSKTLNMGFLPRLRRRSTTRSFWDSSKRASKALQWDVAKSIPLKDLMPMLKPEQQAFFRLLDEELEKVESFYVSREEEMQIK